MARSEQKFRDGDVIFREGDSGDHAYLILEGKVDVSKATERGNIRIGTARKGEYLGESSPIDQGVRMATATAVGRVLLEAIPREEFLDDLQSDPKLAMKVIRNLVKRLRTANDTLIQRVDGEARNRKAQKSVRPGFFARLLKGENAARVDRLEFILAPIGGENGAELTRVLTEALERRKGVRVRVLPKPFEAALPDQDAASIAAFVAAGRRQLAEMDGDLLVVASVPELSDALHLRFVSFIEDDFDRPGVFQAGIALPVPAEFGPEVADLIGAVAFAATVARTDTKAQALREGLPEALEAAMPSVRSMPPELSTRERTAVNICFGNAVATVAHQRGAADMYHVAAQAFQSALESLSKRDGATWILTQKQLATVLQCVAERADDDATYETAAKLFRNAIEAIDKYEYPREWAAMQNRLGEILYRLDMKSSEGDILKGALSAFQAALQVFSKAETPMAWAAVMNNIGQAAQILGQQMRDVEILERAVDACRGALDVRTREKTPLLWAASQNNLGSALFLLGRLVKDVSDLERAADAFEKAREVYVAAGSERMVAVTEKNLAHVQRLLDERQSREGRRMWFEEAPTEGPDVPR